MRDWLNVSVQVDNLLREVIREVNADSQLPRAGRGSVIEQVSFRNAKSLCESFYLLDAWGTFAPFPRLMVIME